MELNHFSSIDTKTVSTLEVTRWCADRHCQT